MPYKDKEKQKNWISNWRKRNKKELSVYYKEYRKNNPEKRKAKDKVNSTIRAGKFPKPCICSQCGKTTLEVKLNYHHEDYSKPLEVISLCCKCHKKVHENKLNRK